MQVPTTLTDANASVSAHEALLERTVQVFLSANLQLLGLGPLQLLGMEYPVDGGRIDILARGDGVLFVIEVKRGVATREAVGQLQAYVGHMMTAEPGMKVRGILVAADLDAHARAALFATPTIDFWSFAVAFTLTKAEIPRQGQALARAGSSSRPTRYCSFCRDEKGVRYVLSAAHCVSCANPF
tara:strand:+ start:7562 stop:8113 length:552 start_codon:yes stop_codon:yes gene_type:complete